METKESILALLKKRIDIEWGIRIFANELGDTIIAFDGNLNPLFRITGFHSQLGDNYSLYLMIAMSGKFYDLVVWQAQPSLSDAIDQLVDFLNTQINSFQNAIPELKEIMNKDELLTQVREYFSGLEWNIRFISKKILCYSSQFGCFVILISFTPTFPSLGIFDGEIQFQSPDFLLSKERVFRCTSENLLSILESLESYLNELVGDILSIKKEWD